MATCLSYAKIAYAAYFTSTNQYYYEPPGHMVDDWAVQKWEKGTLFGNGFQGGIWQGPRDVVVGCCGTNPGQGGKFVQDIIADVKIVLKLIPNQAHAAARMVRAAKSIAAGRRVSVTGHSLGGALAQMAGLWERVPFVTFNAPAMRAAAHAARLNIGDAEAFARTWQGSRVSQTPGMNFRIGGDLVSAHVLGDGHIGTVVDLSNRYAKRADGSKHLGAHGKDTCWQMILETDWAGIDPFEAM